MNALVSMHGIWLLVFAPLAAVVAWRYSGPSLRKFSLFAMILAGMILLGWFGYAAFEETRYATSAYDRAMHSLGVIIGAINFPILQILLATVIVVCWPRKFEFGHLNSIEVSEA